MDNVTMTNEDADEMLSAAEVRGAQWALDACYLAIMRDRTPPIALDAEQRARDAARICAEAGAAACPRCGVYHADGPRACVSYDPRVSARALIERREAAMVRMMDGAREERDRAAMRAEKERAMSAGFRSRLLGNLATHEERGRGGLDWKTADDEILDRVRRGVEVEDAVTAYLGEIDGPLADPASALERLRRAVTGRD